MRCSPRLKRLTQTGVAHFVPVLLVFVILFGVVGTYFYFVSHAAANPPEMLWGVKASGKNWCMNDANGSTAAGNQINTAVCSGSAAQQWTFTGGVIKNTKLSGTFCVQPKNAASAKQTGVVLAACNGAAAQNWVRFQSGFKNTKSGLCLGNPGGVAGTQLAIVTCANFPAQHWTSTTFSQSSSTSSGITGTSSSGSTPSSGSSGGATQSKNCVPNPHLCGFPDATNTGVPAGTTLTNSGSISVTTNGAVVNAKNVSGTIEVHASNVTIKDTKITTGSIYPIRLFSGFSNLTIEDTEINGQSGCLRAEEPDGNIVKMIRINAHGCEDGVQMGGTDTLQDSYIHDLRYTSSSHNDGVQQNGGSGDVVHHNTIIQKRDQTSPINFTTDFGKISNITIDNNLLDGGGYIFNIRNGGSGNPTGVKITNNRLGRNSVYTPNVIAVDGTITSSGNVWDNTGAAVSL